MLTYVFMLLAAGQQRVKHNKKFWNKILIRDFTLEKSIFQLVLNCFSEDHQEH